MEIKSIRWNGRTEQVTTSSMPGMGPVAKFVCDHAEVSSAEDIEKDPQNSVTSIQQTYRDIFQIYYTENGIFHTRAVFNPIDVIYIKPNENV